MTHFEQLQNMPPEALAEFLHQIAETGMQYFLDGFCAQCSAPDCPPENGCLFSPKEMITAWLQQTAE